MKTLKIAQKIPKKWLFAGLAGVAAAAAIAIALSVTLAATPVDTKFTNPNPSFPAIGVGEAVPHAMRGALNATVSGALTLHGTVPPTAEMTSAGAGKLMIESKKFTWEQEFQGVDPDQISGYYFGNGLSGYAPKGATTYQIPYHVYNTAGTSSDNASSRAKISWSSGSALVDYVSSGGNVQILGNGVATLTGTFTDYWGTARTVAFALHIGDTSGRPDLEALQLAINDAETDLATSGVYTDESLYALENEVNSGKNILNSADPNQTDVDNATLAIREAIDGLISLVDLKSAISDAETELIKISDYTAGSLMLLQNAVDSGKNVLAAPNATKLELEAAVKEIRDAIADLEEKGVPVDVTALELILITAETELAKTADYTSGSLALLQTEKISGENVLTNPNAKQAEVDEAVQKNQSALNALVSIKELKDILPSAETELAKTSDYTAGSLALLQIKVTSGKLVLANPSATKLEVDTAVQELRDAQNALISIKELKEALLPVEEELANVSEYTSEGLAEVEPAIDFVKSVIADPNTTQTEIDAAMQKIAEALEALNEAAVFTFVIDTRIEPSSAASGSSAKNIILAISTTKSKNYKINWGDGVVDTNIAEHTYADAKEYTVKISGAITSISFRNSGAGELRLVRVLSSFLPRGISNFGSTFSYCANLTTIPENLFYRNKGAEKLASIFYQCTSLTAIPAGLFAKSPNLESVQQAFSGCSSITEVPPGLFDHNPELTNFTTTFSGCSSLKTIPAGLFDHTTKATLFETSFYSCSSLKAIPTGLFDKTPEVTTFSKAFYGCSSLTAIPAGLFDYTTKVTTFESLFRNCTGLTAIPVGLFDKTSEVMTFESLFRGASGIQAIPAGLFDKTFEVTTFSYTFYGLTNITAIPSGIFDHTTKVTDFSNTFYNCNKVTSALPELWVNTATKFPALTTTTTCFKSCTKASNYASVPTEWR